MKKKKKRQTKKALTIFYQENPNEVLLKQLPKGITLFFALPYFLFFPVK